jgi:hypothetical protein
VKRRTHRDVEAVVVVEGDRRCVCAVIGSTQRATCGVATTRRVVDPNTRCADRNIGMVCDCHSKNVHSVSNAPTKQKCFSLSNFLYGSHHHSYGPHYHSSPTNFSIHDSLSVCTTLGLDTSSVFAMQFREFDRGIHQLCQNDNAL